MRVVFVPKKKADKYADILYQLGKLAVKELDFELLDDTLDLTYDICGMRGLRYGANMADKEASEGMAALLASMTTKEDENDTGRESD